MRRRPIPAIAFLSCLLMSGSAHPCSCAPPTGSDSEQITAAFHNASVVFLGEITSSEMEKWPEAVPLTEVQKTTFRVLKQWKGAKADTLEFRIDIQCCICGFEFPKKGQFLVYGYGPDMNGHYQTSICTRTNHVSEAEKEIEVLDSLEREAAADVASPGKSAFSASSGREGQSNKALQPTCEDARG